MAITQEEYLTSFGRTRSRIVFKPKKLYQQSFTQKLSSFFMKFMIVILLLLCAYCIYEIDIKKESKNVDELTNRFSNLTLKEVYDDTVQAGHVIKTTIIKNIEVASENWKELDKQYEISNRIGEVLKVTAQKLTFGDPSNQTITDTKEQTCVGHNQNMTSNAQQRHQGFEKEL